MVVKLKCAQILWEEKQEQNEETDIIVLSYSLFLTVYYIAWKTEKKYPSLSKLVKINLDIMLKKENLSSFV